MSTNGDHEEARNSLLPSERSDTEKSKRDRHLEELLSTSGYGFFHVILLVVIGFATATDAVEIFGVAFLVPIAGRDLDLTTARKGYLDASIFIGMLIGGYLWGSLSDVFGRKGTLFTAMLLNGVCGLIAAFSPNYAFFVFFRFASGLGVGGSQPIVFSYISEFFTEKQRGPMITVLAACWQPGIVYTALFAWGLLDAGGSTIDGYIGSLHFVNWRLFLIICTAPAFLSAFSILFIPETPAFLFQMGEVEKLEKVLRRIHSINSCCGCCWFIKPVVQADLIPLLREESKTTVKEDELLDPDLSTTVGSAGPGKPSSPTISLCDRILVKAKKIFNFKNLYSKLRKVAVTTGSIFQRKYIRGTYLLLVIWFTQSFSYYGLQLWFPEYFKRLLISENCNETAATVVNCSEDASLRFYQDTLYVALASLPGNIVGVLLINIIGGRIQLVVAMFLSAPSVFVIWSVPSVHAAVVGVSCLFGAVTVTAFSALDVINMTLYDVTARSTAFGVHAGVGRIGAILGNVMFGYLLDVKLYVPILVVALFLTVGAVAAAFLPPIYRLENRPPFVKAISRFKTWLTVKFC